jgi:hypothetical protein
MAVGRGGIKTQLPDISCQSMQRLRSLYVFIVKILFEWERSRSLIANVSKDFSSSQIRLLLRIGFFS